LASLSGEEKPPAPGPRQESGWIRSIEKRTLQVLLLAAAASLLWRSWNVSLGVILGGGVALLNFRWLALIGRKIFLERNPIYGIQVPIKFIALVLAVFLILIYTSIDAVAFLGGTSTLVAGILYEALRRRGRA